MSDTPPAVAILMPDIKPGLRPGQVLLDRLKWPLGRPERLASGTVSDLLPTDHLIGFPQNLLGWWPDRWVGRGVHAQLSVMMAEPAAIHAPYQARVAKQANKFQRVLSYNDDLLAHLPNGIFFPYGSTWVPEWQSLDLTKTRMCSLIASRKKSQTGHELRHVVAGHVQAQGLDVDLLGGGYQPFGDKSEGLAPYRYSVVIENVREKNCFTEKLIDAVLCDTVPIYWGCPNIADFMDTSGMIICENEADIRRALHDMSEVDYETRLPSLRKAQVGALAYADILERAAQAVLTGGPVPTVSI